MRILIFFTKSSSLSIEMSLDMFLFWLFQNEKNENQKPCKNEYELSKMDVYCSKLSQDIVNTE